MNLDQVYHKEFAPLKYQIAEKIKHSPLLPYLSKEQRILGQTFGRGSFILQFALENKSMAENALFFRLNRYGVLEEIERYYFEQMRSSKGEFEKLRNMRKKVISKLSNLNLNIKEKESLINKKKSLEKKLKKSTTLPIYKPVEIKDVAKSLKKENIFFAGIDLVGGYLIGDINVTSPTGLPQYRNLTNINLAQFFWKEVEKLK